MENAKFDGMHLTNEEWDDDENRYKMKHMVIYYKEITIEYPIGVKVEESDEFKKCKHSEITLDYSQSKDKTKGKGEKEKNVQKITYYDVKVDISGREERYYDKDQKRYWTKEEVKAYNKKKKIRIRPYQEGEYSHWFTPDYIDFGGQTIPGTIPKKK